MSGLRPELCRSTAPPMSDATALYMIRDSVARRLDGLIRGRLQRGTLHCAIGAFFDDNPRVTLACSLIDEVAAYNDSILDTATPKTRRRKVLAWLRFRLRVLEGKA